MASFLGSLIHSDENRVTWWDYDEKSNEWDVRLEITSSKYNVVHLDLSLLGPREHIWFWTEKTDPKLSNEGKMPVCYQTLFMNLDAGGSATLYMKLINTKLFC